MNRLIYWAYLLGAAISRHLPLPLAYWVGLRIGDQFYFWNRPGRQAVMDNIRQIYVGRGIQPAEAAIRGMARKVFQYFGKYLVDFFRYSVLTPEEVRRIVSIEHVDYLTETYRRGRGLVVVTAHFGNWELGAAVAATLGLKVNALELPQPNAKLNRLFQAQRRRRGINLISVGQSALGVVRRLKRGEMVAVLGDRDFSGRNAHCLDFFGRPAPLPRGPAWLALNTGAPIVVGFLIRQVDDSFLLRLYPPIEPQPEATENEIRGKIARILEKEIGERPYQWFIFDPFWPAEGQPTAGNR